MDQTQRGLQSPSLYPRRAVGMDVRRFALEHNLDGDFSFTTRGEAVGGQAGQAREWQVSNECTPPAFEHS